jgi:hypothetical protein
MEPTVVVIGEGFKFRNAMGEAWGFVKSQQMKHGNETAFIAMAYVLGIACKYSKDPQTSLQKAYEAMKNGVESRL